MSNSYLSGVTKVTLGLITVSVDVRDVEVGLRE